MVKILVIDDQPLVLSVTKEVLEVMGRYEVTACSSGEQAVKLVEGGIRDFTLCIIDFNTGGGFDGTTLRAVLASFLPKETVFFLVASVDNAPEGFKRFFPKPTSVSSLLEAIKEVIKEKAEV